MKSLYVCEKCGKSYEDYDQAYACENSHVDVNPSQEIPDMNPEWKPGEIMPGKVTLESAGIWNQEISKYETVFGIYKLVRLCNPDENAQILANRKVRQEEQEAEWEKWRQEREAKKREAEKAENPDNAEVANA